MQTVYAELCFSAADLPVYEPAESLFVRRSFAAEAFLRCATDANVCMNGALDMIRKGFGESPMNFDMRIDTKKAPVSSKGF